MYKVLIVDDEFLERKGLRKILTQEFESNLNIKEAENGRIAIDKALTFKPDIIFMDIKMPGINGIEAMKKIKQSLPEVSIVIISAFDSFEYAQEALNNNAYEYLLKPVKKKDIINSVTRLMNYLKRKEENKIEKIAMEERLLQSDFLIYSKIIDYIRLNQVDKLKIIKKKEIIDFNFTKGICVVVSLNSTIHLQEQIIELIDQIFKKNIKMIKNSQLIFFVPFGSLDEITTLEEVIFEKISIKVPVFFEKYLDLSEISTAYHDTMKNTIKNNISKKYPIDIENEMLSKIDLLLKDEAIELLDKLFLWLERNIGKAEKKLRYLEAIKLLIDRQLFDKVKEEKLLVLEKIEGQDIDTQIKGIKNRIKENIIQYTTKLDKSATDDIIELSKIYMKNNYEKDLTLEEVAKEMCISSYYFSKLFKKKTGVNFIDYLTEIRINAAKVLLRNTNSTIKKISRKVGYNDPNYFSRVFKKHTEQSPSQYKKK